MAADSDACPIPRPRRCSARSSTARRCASSTPARIWRRRRGAHGSNVDLAAGTATAPAEVVVVERCRRCGWLMPKERCCTNSWSAPAARNSRCRSANGPSWRRPRPGLAFDPRLSRAPRPPTSRPVIPCRAEQSSRHGLDRPVEGALRHPWHAGTIEDQRTESNGCIRMTNRAPSPCPRLVCVPLRCVNDRLPRTGPHRPCSAPCSLFTRRIAARRQPRVLRGASRQLVRRYPRRRPLRIHRRRAMRRPGRFRATPAAASKAPTAARRPP